MKGVRRSSVNQFIAHKSILVSEVIDDDIYALASKINSDQEKQQFQAGKEELYEMVAYILCKPNKNHCDLDVMKYYLQQFQSLNSLLKLKTNTVNPEEMLSKLALFLQLEHIPVNRMICQNGEKGDKYYLILKGQASVLVPCSYQMQLTEEEYCSHLKELKEYGEYELITKTIDSNRYAHLNLELTQSLSPQALLKAEERGRDNNEEISVENYCNRIIPLHVEDIVDEEPRVNRLSSTKLLSGMNLEENMIEKEYKPMYNFILWKYREICKLTTGATFGDIALNEDDSRRTATIMTLEDTHLGSLTKATYHLCFRDAQEKIRRQQISNILSNKLFGDFYANIFEKHYFNYFRIIHYRRGEGIFSQGSPRQNVYFLIDGEIELSTKSSLNYLSIIIESLGEIIPNKPNLDKLQRINPDLAKYYQKTMEFRVFGMKNKEIIGLDDSVINGDFFLSAKCKSDRCEMYVIEYDLFNKILSGEHSIRKNNKIVQKDKKTVMINRLSLIKDITLSSYCNSVSIDNTISIPKKAKRKIILPRLKIDASMVTSSKKTLNNREESFLSIVNKNQTYNECQLSNMKTASSIKHKEKMPPNAKLTNTKLKILFHREICEHFNDTQTIEITKDNNDSKTNIRNVDININNTSTFNTTKHNHQDQEKNKKTIPIQIDIEGYNSQHKKCRMVVNDLMEKVMIERSSIYNSPTKPTITKGLNYSTLNVTSTPINTIDCLIVDKCLKNNVEEDISKSSLFLNNPRRKIRFPIKKRKKIVLNMKHM